MTPDLFKSFKTLVHMWPTQLSANFNRGQLKFFLLQHLSASVHYKLQKKYINWELRFT